MQYILLFDLPEMDIEYLFYIIDLLHSHLKVPEEMLSNDWPEVFFRKYVSKNMPVVLRGDTQLSEKAINKWHSEYFMLVFFAYINIYFNNIFISRKTLADKEVTVALTPNGYADGLNTINNETYFVLPEEKRMFMKDFLTLLKSKK